MFSWIGSTFRGSYSAFETIKKTLVPESSVLLPGNLSGQILDLQFQCEQQTVTHDQIYQLMELYTEAVEYYEQMNNGKYKIYKKRMQQFLKKPIIEEILQGKTPKLVSKRRQVTKKLDVERKKSRSEFTKLMGDFDKTCSFSKEVVTVNLTEQNRTLENRIQKRKTMSNRSIYSECESYEEENEEIKGFEDKLNRSDVGLGDVFKSSDSKWKRLYI